MGLLEDLSALALAPLLRRSAERTPRSAITPQDAVLRLLDERLAHAGGELAALLLGICQRSWEALECQLAADALRKLCDEATIRDLADRVFRQSIRDFLDAFPVDESLRSQPELVRDCLAELKTLRTATLVPSLAGPIERQALIEAAGALLRASAQTLASEEQRLVARMAQSLATAGFARLTELLGQQPLPLLVRAARAFLGLEVSRDPRPLWGPRLLQSEPPERRQERALTALDQALTQNEERLRQWLDLLEPPAPVPPAGPPPGPGGQLSEIYDQIQHLLQQIQPVRRPPDSFSGSPDEERKAVKEILARYRAQPAEPCQSMPALLESIGKLEVAAGSFETAPGFARVEAMRASVSEQPITGQGPAESLATTTVVRAPKQDLRRRASLRWFRRMNPDRMYPLTVVLARGRVKEVRAEGVSQAVSPEMLVIPESSPFIVVRPVLPGVLCYPSEQTVDVTPDLVTVRFQVLPQMLGEVPDARIEFYWRERLLSQVPVPMKVSRQTLALVVSAGGLLWPFLGSAVKALGGDAADSQDVVLGLLTSFFRWPHAIEVGLLGILALALGLFWRNRPRESSEETDVLAVRPMSLDELLSAARQAAVMQNWEEAVGLYEDAVNVGPDDPVARAGLAAAREQLGQPHPVAPAREGKAGPVARTAAEAYHSAYLSALRLGQWDLALENLREAVRRERAACEPFPFAKYEPRRILGAGGFSVAFLCQNLTLGSLVVVKALHPSERARPADEVFAEAHALVKLDHPSIIRVRDCDFAGADRSRPFLVMDYFEGISLHEQVTRHGPLSPEATGQVARAVAEGLRAAHERGILHRDVKPANLLLRAVHGEPGGSSARSWEVKLIDFGLALDSRPPANLTDTTVRSKSIAGTLDYAAPEQLGRLPSVPVGPHSDVYGFGRTCYFSLLGTPVPDDDEVRQLPRPWQELLRACTTRLPANRLSDFAVVLTRLTRLSG